LFLSAAGEIVQKHGLPDPAKAPQRKTLIGASVSQPLQEHIEPLLLLLASSQLGWNDPRPGRVWVSNRIHSLYYSDV
jgi:hypothetical protein